MESCVESDPASPRRTDEPLQLIEFTKTDKVGNTSIKLCESTVKLLTEKAGDRPLSTIGICGPSRQGKSFLLGHMIRCLESLETGNPDWMDWENKSKPLEGFKFRNGTAPETQGIWVWSRPFIVKNDDGKQIAVLLIDTQGTDDEFTTKKDMSAIVGLSLLTSSVIIFNCFNNLQEDILSAMNTYTHYGQLALDNSKDIPFQKLIFLIRDWNHPGEYTYGNKGGKNFLEEKLRIKEDQPLEAQDVRKSVKSCFQDVDCFLMPAIGDKALYPEFTGSIAELAPNFAKNMEKFISSLISSDTLVVKEVLGGGVTAGELFSFLDNYLQIFNSSELPSAKNMWEATSDVHNTHVVKTACKKFSDLIIKYLRGKNYLSVEDLEEAQTRAEKQAVDFFKNARKFGSPEKISEYEEQLMSVLKKERLEFKNQNEEKRRKHLNAVLEDALTKFRNLLEEFTPLDENDPTVFYDDAEINRASDQAKDVVIQEIRDKLDVETEEAIKTKIESFDSISDTSLSSHMNRNRIIRAESEKKLRKIVDDLVGDFEQQVKKFLEQNKFAEEEELTYFQADVSKSKLELWKETKKPGKKSFHGDHQTKLEKELEALSTKLENELRLHLQQCQLDGDTKISEICEKFEQSVGQAAEGIHKQEDLKLIYGQLKAEVLKDFAKIHNPFPDNHSMHEKFNKKLNSQLEGIMEKVEREALQRQQRIEESYQQAVEKAQLHYVDEMNKIQSSSAFVSEESLQLEHDRLLEESLEKFETFPKEGDSDNAENFKQQLETGVSKEYTKVREENERKRELVKMKAQSCVTDCLTKYNDVMKRDMDRLRSEEQLKDLHDKALQEALNMFYEQCPAQKDADFAKIYEEELEKEITENYTELKAFFELKRGAEDVAVREILADCRKHYHDQMQKHCKNTTFIRPNQLKEFHKQSVAVTLDKCGKRVPLSAGQKLDLEQEMDSLFEKYLQENVMKLNFDAGHFPAIGIDLGTTYCCVAVYINGKVVIIPNQGQANSDTTASYVAHNPDGSKTFGNLAKENAFRNPENTIYDAKRMIGRKFDDPELQGDMKFWPFQVVGVDGVPKININGTLYFPEQISAELLRQLRLMAEKHLGLKPDTIKKAVITVPAYFNDGQRQATVDAGELAGLEVLTILNEPTAAAIAYSMERLDNSPTKVLIFDLGGGTFDVVILDVTPKKIEALTVNGDTHLGGEDFDQKMMEYCALMFKAKEGIDLFAGKDSSVKQERDEARRRLRRLTNECEKAKKALSSGRKATVALDVIYKNVDLSVEVTRKKFEELNEVKFRETIKIVDKALRDTGMRKEEIEDVVLVGGSTRIPKIQELLSEYFEGKALNYSIHPDQAVAYGAAVKAAMMNGEQLKGKIDFEQIIDVTPLPLGIEDASKNMSVIIPKSTKVPARLKEAYTTVKDNQESCHIKIFQGEEFVAANNEPLGDFILEGVPPALAGKEMIDVFMEINSMGILHVEAVIKSTKGSNKITVRENKKRMNPETKRRLLAEFSS